MDDYVKGRKKQQSSFAKFGVINWANMDDK